MVKDPGKGYRQKVFLLAYILISLLILVFVYTFYSSHKQGAINNIKEELKSIADLKLSEIETWLSQRHADAYSFAESPNTQERFEELLSKNDPVNYDALYRKIKVVKDAYKYEEVILTDTLGKVRISTEEGLFAISKTLQEILLHKSDIAKPFISDLYWCDMHKRIHLDFIAPMHSARKKKGNLIGYIILRTDPYNYLYPLINKWPTESKTAENFLVKQDKDSVVYLNEVRLTNKPALSLKIPITRTNVPAVRAVLGNLGVYEGYDYRNVKVLSYSVKVPNTNWFLLSKVDMSEIYSPIKYQTWVVIVILLLTMSLVWISFFYIKSSLQKKHYMKLLEMEVERKILVNHFEHLVKYANDIIILANGKGKIVEANESAMSAYQYTADEIKGIKISSLGKFNIEFDKEWIRKENSPNKLYESVHKRKNGEEFPVEINEQIIEIDGSKYFQAIIRDITERKLVEQKLQENENRLSLIFNLSPIGIVITRPEDGFILDSNKAYSQIFGYEPQEIIGKSTIELNLWVDLNDRDQINKVVSESGMVKNFEARVRKIDGEIRYIEGNVERIEINGKYYNLSLVSDVTERKQAGEKLRASEEKWRNLFGILPVGVSIVSPENEVIESNNALAKILDISQDGLTAGKYRTRRYFRADNTLMPYEEFPSLLALKDQKTIRDVEIGVEKEDGSRIWTSVSAAPLTAMGDTVTVTVDITARKLVDDKLRESEERLSLVLEGSQLGYWDWNIETGEVYRNARWAEMLGYTLDEIQHSVKQWTDLHHPDDKEAAMKSIQDHLEDKTTAHRIEYRMRSKNGQYKWILDQARIVERDVTGKPLRMCGTHTDITELKQAEISIKESERRFASLFRSNPTPIGITSVSDYRIFDVNDTWCKLTGYSREEAIGRNSTELGLASPQTLDLVNAMLQTHGEMPQTEIQLYTRIGEERHVLLSSETIEIAGENYVLNNLVDFTERKNSEKKLRESEQRFSQVAEQSQTVIWEVDAEGLYTYVSPLASCIWGYTPDELVGKKHYYDIHPAEGREEFKKATLEAIGRHEKFSNLINAIETPNGKIIWVMTSGTPFYNNNNDFIGYIGSDNDITAVKQANEALVESELFARSTLNGLSAHIAIVDNTGRIIAVNNAWRNFAENKPPLLSNVNEGANYLEACDKASGEDELIAKQAATALREILSGKEEIVEIEYACHSPKEQRWFIARISRFPGDGSPKAVIAHENITELKKVENALIQSEETHRILFEHNPIPMWVYELETLKFLRVNEVASEKYGYTMDEFLGMTLKDIRPEEEAHLLTENVKNIGNERIQRSGAWKHKLKSGEIILVEIHSHSMIYEGKGARLVAAYDITQRVENENKIKKSEEQFRSTLDNMIEGCQIIDKDWRYVYINAAAEKQNRVPSSKLIGEKYAEMWPGVESTIVYRKLKKCLEEGIADHFENEFSFSDGTVGWFEIGVQPVPEGVFILSVDITERIKTERSLRESEVKFKKIYEEGPFGMVLMGPDFKFMMTNRTFCHIVGYNEEELLKMSFRDITHPDDVDEDFSNVQKLIRGEIPVYKKQKRYVRKDKSQIWTSLTVTANFSHEEKFLYCVAIVEDISEQRKAAEIVRTSEIVHRQLFENNPMPIAITTVKDGRFYMINDAYTQQMGYTANDVIGEKVSDFNIYVNPNVRQEIVKLIKEKGSFKNYEIQFRAKSGSLVFFELSMTTILISNEECILSALQNITERKQTEEKIRELNRRINLAAQSANIGIWDWNIVKNEMLWDERMFALYGIESSKGKFPYEVWLKGLHPDDREISDEISKRAVLGEIEYDTEFRVVWPDGSIHWLKANGQVFYDDNKDPIRMIGVNYDITKRKQIENEILDFNTNLEIKIKERTIELAEINETLTEEIEERKSIEQALKIARQEADKANVAKSEFLSRMSHELRTPLNSILGFAQLLGMGDLNPAQDKGVKHIMKSGRHLLDLINEVLDISKIEAGRLSLSPEPIQINGIINEMMDVVAPLAVNRKIQIVFTESETNKLFVKSDKQRLKQILLNLINNAIKYNREGGKVIIRTQLMPLNSLGYVPIRISVVDTGFGISKENIVNLFKPFERIGAEYTETEGSGLGLAVVKSLVDAMGGTLGVESEVDKGSVFWLELPQVEGQLQRLEKDGSLINSPNGPEQKEGMVLYVEDNLSNFELVAQVFSAKLPNVKLLTTVKGREVKDLAFKEMPNLILLDLNLPDMHGSEVFNELQKDDRTKTIPVVVISADATPQQVEKLISAGVKYYLTKPLDIMEFLKVVNEFVS